MPTVTDYHQNVRDAVAAALAPLSVGCPVRAFDSPDDMLDWTLPLVGVACVGPEQDRPDWGTNLSDGVGYPVVVALLTRGTTRGERAGGPLEMTAFRRLVKTTFHMKRLSAVTRVGFCEVSDAGGGIFDEKSPHFQKLQTALVVTAVGRFPRT